MAKNADLELLNSPKSINWFTHIDRLLILHSLMTVSTRFTGLNVRLSQPGQFQVLERESEKNLVNTTMALFGNGDLRTS